jgi:hypothetical protein
MYSEVCPLSGFFQVESRMPTPDTIAKTLEQTVTADRPACEKEFSKGSKILQKFQENYKI